jgi:hypothetical protein
LLPIDVPVVTVSGAMTMDGALAPDAFAWLSIPTSRSPFTGPYSLDRKMLHMIEGSYSVTATPGSYAIHYDSCDPTIDVETCYIADHPPLPQFPVSPSQRIVPLTTFEVGSEDVQLDIDVPTVTVAGTISLDGQPTTGYFVFRKGYDFSGVGNGFGAPDGVFSERWIATQYDQVVLYTIEPWSDVPWGEDYYAAALVPELQNIDADVNLELARSSASVTVPWSWPGPGPESGPLGGPYVLSWLPDVSIDFYYPSTDILEARWPAAEALSIWPGVRSMAIVGDACWPDYEPDYNADRFVAIMLGDGIDLSGEIELGAAAADELAAVHVDMLWEGPVMPTHGGLRIEPIARPPEACCFAYYESFPEEALDVHGYFPRGPARVMLENVPVGVVDIQDGTTVFVRATLEPIHSALQVDGKSVSIEHLYTTPVDQPTHYQHPITDARPPGRYNLIYDGRVDGEVVSDDGLPDNHDALVGCITREG